MSAGVSRSSAERGKLLHPVGDPRLAGGGDVSGAAALAEGGPDRARRGEDEGVGPGPVAVGDDRRIGRRDAGQEAVELARVEQRAVAGEEDDAARPRGRPRARCRPGSPRSGRRRGCRGSARRRFRGGGRRAGLVADDDGALDHPRRGDRLEHVGEHRRDELPAPVALDAGGEAALRLGESLDGEYRGRLQPSPELAARSRTMRASLARAAAPSISVGAASVGISSGGGSGSSLVDDHRVDQPGVERGDPARGRGPADRRHEPLGRPFDDLAGDVGADRDDRGARRRDRLPHPRHREDRADADHRVGGADHDRVGIAQGGRAPRPSARPRRFPRARPRSPRAGRGRRSGTPAGPSARPGSGPWSAPAPRTSAGPWPRLRARRRSGPGRRSGVPPSSMNWRR